MTTKQETIVKIKKRENPYVQVDKTVFEDTKLSNGSKGLMGYLLSRPANWKVLKSDLLKRSTDSETAIETQLIELMMNGYIHFYQERGENGKFGNWVYLVFELPELNPYLEESVRIGTEKWAARKEKNKRNNAKKKAKQPKGDNHGAVENPPEGDNHGTVEPKRDNPEADNPEPDNAPTNNKDVTKKDFKENDFKDININKADAEIENDLQEARTKHANEMLQAFKDIVMQGVS
jgi:hypothetical protein